MNQPSALPCAPEPATRPRAGTGEGGKREVQKDKGKRAINEEVPVFGSGAPAVAKRPQMLREQNSEECEEHARNLKPKDGSGMRERVPQSPACIAAATANAARGTTESFPFADAGGRTKALFGRGWRRGWCGKNALGKKAHADTKRAS